ncbi:hypothetical protein E4U33_000181 [Claviceps sp. LM78 group G4]|nr:hypothetical protein E4U33_000181 [Claviceps sp. LM78 group G4]
MTRTRQPGLEEPGVEKIASTVGLSARSVSEPEFELLSKLVEKPHVQAMPVRVRLLRQVHVCECHFWDVPDLVSGGKEDGRKAKRAAFAVLLSVAAAVSADVE